MVLQGKKNIYRRGYMVFRPIFAFLAKDNTVLKRGGGEGGKKKNIKLQVDSSSLGTSSTKESE